MTDIFRNLKKDLDINRVELNRTFFFLEYFTPWIVFIVKGQVR
jgi:hypothetical protein